MSDEINARIHPFCCLLRFFFFCNFYQSFQSVVLVNEIYWKFRNSFPNDNRNGDGSFHGKTTREKEICPPTNVPLFFRKLILKMHTTHVGASCQPSFFPLYIFVLPLPSAILAHSTLKFLYDLLSKRSCYFNFKHSALWNALLDEKSLSRDWFNRTLDQLYSGSWKIFVIFCWTQSTSWKMCIYVRVHL